MDGSREITKEPIVLMRERITAGLCVDCAKPVFTMGGWRCDGCTDEHYNDVRDSEGPCVTPDEEAA